MGSASTEAPRPSAHLRSYVPRVLLRQLATDPDALTRTVEGTVLFADVSGFTALSERLARRGREGAELLVDAIGGCFDDLLRVAYANGGGLVKFGGDALLVLFEGERHVQRACVSAIQMRRTLRTRGRIDVAGARATLRMSVGIHSGDFHLFLVGGSHRALIVAGPAATTVVRMEQGAEAGEIVVSPDTASRLPARCVGAPKGAGTLLARAPTTEHFAPDEPDWRVTAAQVERCLPTAVRAHVLPDPQPPEHRSVSVAFLQFKGTDELIAREGPEAAAQALDALVRTVQRAADQQGVTFLESDVDAGGGKLMLAAGTPRTTGDDEARLLVAARRIMDADLPLPLRIGINRGAVFAGSVGPDYRKTYTVMGDAVNLAARVMAKAPPGAIYVTGPVLERSVTRFDTAAVPPFTVKGKTEPVHAWSLGATAARQGTRQRLMQRVPLIGRDAEMGELDAALAALRGGQGRLVQLSGEAGVGKTRLIEEVLEHAADIAQLHVVCDTYDTATPYALWRDVLHQAIGAAADEVPERVLERLRGHVERLDPDLERWLPLLAIPLGIDLPPTPEVAELAPAFRQSQLHEVVIRFLRLRLAAPVIIDVEHAHFMDAASAELLDALVRSIDDTALLVLLTRRDTDAGYTAEGAHVRLIEPEPLTPPEALALAESLAENTPLPPQTLHLAAQRSGGNPQFLRDLLRAAATGAAHLPDSIEAAAMARIDQLPAEDRALVRRASVLGLSFHLRHIAAVLDRDAAPPERETWERLTRYFDLDGNGYLHFRRALVRDVAYGSLPFGTRRRLHAAAGAQLERELVHGADETAAVLSVHFEAAGDHGRAWRYAREAGDRARSQYAHADAAVLYARAIGAGRAVGARPEELAEVWEALGEVRAAGGELGSAQEALTTARRLLAHDPVQQARLMHRHAQVEVRAGRSDRALRWANRGLRLLEGVAGPAAGPVRAQLAAAQATARQRQGRMRDAIEVSRRAIAEAEAAGEQAALAHAYYVLDWALVECGRAAEAVHSQRALAIYESLGDLDRQAAVLNNLGGFAYRDGRWDDAIELYRRGAEASGRAGDAANAAFGDCGVGEVLGDQGHVETGEAALRRALRIWRGTDYAWGVAYALSRLGRLAARTGRAEESQALLEESLLTFEEVGARSDAAFVSALTAEAALFTGEPEVAATVAEQVLAEDDEAAWTAPLLHRVRGCAAVALGDPSGGEAVLEHALVAAREQGDQFEVALTLDALERVSGAPSPDRVLERDALVKALGIVALPALGQAPPPAVPGPLSPDTADPARSPALGR